MRTDTGTTGAVRWRPVVLRLTLVVAVLTVLTATPAIAKPGTVVQATTIVQEHNFDGTPNEDQPQVGVARLTREADGLTAKAQVEGLIPGGVYTFWWVVVQEDGTFPEDIYVQYGDGAIAAGNGRAVAYMSAAVGDGSIAGFAPGGTEITFADLEDTMGSLVRIEIAYHGQAEDAGDDLDVWLSDFWTGSACPPDTPNPNPAQPHCPVWYAATFT